MKQQTTLDQPPGPGTRAHLGLEFRHLRYLVAVADAGTFTGAAERLFIAQPTLSQQIRRLEEMVGAPLLDRRRDGVRLTFAGRVLLEESRAVLSRLEHGVCRSQQAAGLGRPRLRFVLQPGLPDQLAVTTARRLRSVAAAAGAEVSWAEAPLDGQFTLIRQRHADAGLGWLTPVPETPADPLEVMSLGKFEPDVWVPAGTVAGQRGLIGLPELAGMDVVHGPRRAGPGTYDAWLPVLRAVRPRFAFTDPPFRHSLPMTLAFAATASRPAAVLTGPQHAAGDQAVSSRRPTQRTCDMVRVGLERRPLTATAAVAWSADLPRHLQQLLFDTADTINDPPHPPAAAAS